MGKAQKAQTKNPQNPFGLVYEGAIAENVNGRVNIHPLTYTLNGINIVANVYTPPNYDAAKKYPAVVIAHPNGGVKEQVAGLYAQRLAEEGYITITADAAYQGGSGGSPRNVDRPANRVEDIYGMGDFISRYKGVDTSKIGLLGICGGGGYSLKAAQADKRFRAVATVSMFNSGVVRRNGFMNSQVATIQERLKQASDARATENAGGEVRYVGTAELTDEMADKMPFDLYREGHYYYNRTHAHPNSTFRYTMSSLMDLMTWDATSNMDLIDQPLLMIAGSKADTYYMTDDAFGKAINAKNKELFLINGATHIETYWKPQYVSQAINKLVSFFEGYLKTAQSPAGELQETSIFSRGNKITNDNFVGTAYLQPLIAADSLNPASVGNVTFEPGARTRWHVHPGGQILLAIGGVGFYQEKGSPKKVLRKGDVVKCPPNVPHWHGASLDQQFIQVAITNTQNGPTQWLHPVSEEDYSR